MRNQFCLRYLAAFATFSVASSQAHGTNLIDVRTPNEFAMSHLVGSVNIDVLSADFDLEISKLDRELSYLLYCKTGGRTARAIKRMNDLGFLATENLGSLEEAASKLGLPCENLAGEPVACSPH